MTLRMFLLLACFPYLTHGRRVQAPTEHIQHEGTIHSFQSKAYATKAYATHLFAQQVPSLQGPALDGSPQHRLAVTDGTDTRTLVDAGSPWEFASENPHSRVHGVSMNMHSSELGLDDSGKDSHASSLLRDVLPNQQEVENIDGVHNSATKPSRKTWTKKSPPLKMVENAQLTPEEGMLASSPSFAVFLNYISLAFAGMMYAMTPKGEILDRLNRMSNVASVLCAIDCTVFPILLTVLPLVSAVSTGAEIAWLHEASHACALWFVGPVGGLAVILNWVQHKRPLVGLWGLSGIATIILANIHLPHTILGEDFHAIGDFVHEWHSQINVIGCILLLSSQRYSHRLVHGEDCECDDCDVKETAFSTLENEMQKKGVLISRP